MKKTRRNLFGIILASIMVVSTALSMMAYILLEKKLLNAPFPGFFISTSVGPLMEQTTTYEHPTKVIISKVDDLNVEPPFISIYNRLKTKSEIYEYVRKFPAGREFTYTIKYLETNEEKQVKIKSRIFEAGDYWGMIAPSLDVFVFIFMIGLVYYFRPNDYLSWNLMLLFLMMGNFFMPIGGVTDGRHLMLLAAVEYLMYFFYYLTPFGFFVTLMALFLGDSARLRKAGLLIYLAGAVYSFAILLFANACSEFCRVVFPYIGLGCVIGGFSLTFYARYKSMDVVLRQRAKIFLFTIFLMVLTAGMGAILVYMEKIIYLGSLFVHLAGMLFAVSIVNASLRHNLFEVDEIIKNTFKYVSVTIISGIVYGVVFLLLHAQLSRYAFYGNRNYILATLVFFILIFRPLKNYIQAIIDRSFFKTRVDYEKVMEETMKKLSVVVSKEKIYEAIRDIAVEHLFLSDVDILLSDDNGGYRSIEKKVELKKGDELLHALIEKKGLLSKNELLNDQKYRDIKFKCLSKLAGLESIFLLPIMFREEMLGIMALGERRSGDITFNLQDMEVLHFLAVQASTAYENTRLYGKAEEAKKELEKLNGILEEKVRIRTEELEARASALEEQNSQIAFATHNKTTFLAGMAHELRTPLTGMLGFGDIVIDGIYGKLNPVAKEVMIDLVFNGKELLHLINDILDLAKIEAGKMEWKMDEFSPLYAVDGALKSWILEMENKGIKVNTEFARDLPFGMGEEKRIRQILDTLLRNAVRWSQTKKITIRVTCAPEHQSTRKKVLLFEVEDYGVGIEAYRMPKLFVEHEYPQILDLQYYKNVGVGLALAKKWAELHGGEMWAESAEGKGSKFSFTIPAKQ